MNDFTYIYIFFCNKNLNLYEIFAVQNAINKISKTEPFFSRKLKQYFHVFVKVLLFYSLVVIIFLNLIE